MASTEDVLRRYFAIVADIESTVDDLRAIVAPTVVFAELPNPIAPTGARRDLAQTIEGFEAGKNRLSKQVDRHPRFSYRVIGLPFGRPGTARSPAPRSSRTWPAS